MLKLVFLLFSCTILFAQQAQNSYTLHTYLERLLKEDIDYKNKTLESKVLLLSSLLEQSRYNPDIFLDATARQEKQLDVLRGNEVQTNIGANINFNMRLYDAQKKLYTRQRTDLFNALSDLKILDAKEQLQLLGVQLYVNLYKMQQTIKAYNKLLYYQEKITQIATDRSAKGLGDIYDRTQAINDLINIKLRLADLKERFIQTEYAFRQSINLDSGAPVVLQPINYADLPHSLKKLQHDALAYNIGLKLKTKEFEMAQSDLALSEKSDGLSVDFTSHYGYGYTKEPVYIPGFDDNTHGDTWSAGLSVKYPLYAQNKTEILTQESKVRALQARNRIELQKKELSRTINRLYNAWEKYMLKNELYQEQKNVLQERIEITYNRYKEALESYKPYSDALRDMALSEESYINNRLSADETVLDLYILTGRTIVE